MTLPVKAARGAVVTVKAARGSVVVALMRVKAHRGALQFAVERLVWVIKHRGCAIKREVGGACTVTAIKRARGGWVHDGVSDGKDSGGALACERELA